MHRAASSGAAVIFRDSCRHHGAQEASRRSAAKEQPRIAEIRRLAAESTSVLTEYPQRSLLLAVEAVKVEADRLMEYGWLRLNNR